MELAAGQLVTPHVRLVRPLGEGGMGSLWVAEHLVERKEVAVKFVWQDLAQSDPTILQRFDREADVLSQLTSPHVVKLYKRGKTPDGTPFIVMELLHGETLVDRIERMGAFDLYTVGFVVSQIAAGLQHIHGHNIVHRDMKGENIFLLGQDVQPLAKILDFGLSKPFAASTGVKLTGVGTLVGTAEYMSPEQILSAKDVDHRADLWALAVLTYIMLVADLPFRGGKTSELFMAIRTSQFTPPTALREGLQPAIDEWFQRAFALSGVQRFQSAAEMNEAWQRASAAAPPKSPDAAGLPLGVLIALLAIGVLTVFAALFLLL